MLKLLGRWVLTAVPLVFVVSALTFVLASLVPGDAARSILGVNAPPAQYEALRAELGLDDPLPERYWDWLTDAVRGDLGQSIANQDSISHQLGVRIGVTFFLIAGAVLVAATVGVGLGILGAMRRGVVGRAIDVIALVGAAVPAYWFGLVLAYFFAVKWEIFPAISYVPFAQSPLGWLKSLTLPVLTLGLTSSAAIAKQTRNGVLTELDKDYVTVLRARGIPERSIILKHVLRNASAPIVTVLGLMVIGLLGGTVLVESLFVLPGLGGMTVAATRAHDIPAIQGAAVVFTVIVVLVNLLTELVYAALDPKVRT